MLRLLFVSALVLLGIYYSLQGAFYVLLFYLWNGYFRPEEWVWSSLLYQLRLSLAIGSLLIVASLPHFKRIRLTPELALILLFFGQSTVSLLLSRHIDPATTFWIEFLKVIVVSALITVLVDDAGKLRLAFVVIAFSLGLEAAKQGWAQLIFNPGAPNVNTHPVLGDNNGIAMGMMMLVPIFLGLARTTENKWERRLHYFFMVGVLYRGLSTYSRGGLLAAATVGLILLARSKYRVRGLVAVVVLAVGIGAVMPQEFWDRMGTITASEDDRDASAASRLYFWELAAEMAADHPMTGVGFNSYRYEYSTYDRTAGQFGDIRAVHSVWFGVLADLGYPGIIIFVALLVRIFLSLRRSRANAILSGRTDLETYASSLEVSLVAFVVGGTFLTAHYLEMLWHFMALTVALGLISRTAVTSVGLGHGAPVRVRPQATPADVVRPRRIPERTATGANPRRFF